MASIASIVSDFKRDPQRYLPDDLIHDAIDAAGHRWRDRLLGPVVTRGKRGRGGKGVGSRFDG